MRRRWYYLETMAVFVAAAAVAAVAAGQPPAGQPGGAPGMAFRMTPEQSEEAWALQANHVAAKLGLSEENAAKLVDAYKTVKKDYLTALTERRAAMSREPGAMEEARKAMAEVADTARGNLRKAVSAFLDEKQTETAVERLGNFDFRWDAMVRKLAEFKLGDKQADALELVNLFIIESGKLVRSRMAAGAPPEDLRERNAALRAKLDEDLAKILSEEQLAEWKQSTARGGPRGAMIGGGRPARERSEEGER